MHRSAFLALAVLGSIALAVPAVRAAAGDDDENESEHEGGHGRGRGRAAVHDVQVRLSKTKGTPAGTRFRVEAKNRGRSAEPTVTVSVWSDADPNTPVWQATTSLNRGRSQRWTLVLELPEGAGSLHATTDLGPTTVDQNPGNDDDEQPLPTDPGTGAGTGSGGGSATAAAGRDLWNTSCASCHGALGTGGIVHERVVGKGANEILEAVREGEDGMPRFPGISLQDARNIAEYLRDPNSAGDPGTGTGGTGGTGTGGTGTGGSGTGGTGTGGTGGTGTTTPTYTGQIAAILSANCTGCHTGAAASMKIRLDTYATAKTNAARALAAIQAGRMPPSGPLSSGTVATFAAWVNGGKPQ